jgi:hypothetical protein
VLRVRVVAAAVLAIVLGAPAALAASAVDPRLRFRTLTTEHFVIYFHQDEESPGSRKRRGARSRRGSARGRRG